MSQKFQKVGDSEFLRGEHEVLRLWTDRDIFARLREKNRGGAKWSFLDGPITANNPMGVHHAWGRTYKDVFQRFHAMCGRELRYQNGFDCQGLWVEVEVEKELGSSTKGAIEEYGIDRFVTECKRRVLRYAARQTEQSVRLGYWMDWDDPDQLRRLADALGTDEKVTITTPSGLAVTGPAHQLVARLGNPDWGGSYFTFSTENNETIWTFLKKCFDRKEKGPNGFIYRGHDVMPWSGRAGSAYSQMEVADGRRLTVHRSVFVRFPIVSKAESGEQRAESRTENSAAVERGADTHNPLVTSSPESNPTEPPNKEVYHEADASSGPQPSTLNPQPTLNEYLLIWTTTPWTLTSNVAAAVNPELEYVKLRTKRDGAVYYFAKDNLDYKRLDKEFKEGFGRPEWQWPKDVPKLKTLSQIFKEQGGYEILGTLKGSEMIGWRYAGPFDDLPAQQTPGGFPSEASGGRQPAVVCLSGLRNDESAETQRRADAPRSPSAIQCHRVIDGGRDSKGNPMVTAGEGTGIVHIAPGCGDVDHQLGEQLGLPSIAPLKDDGTFDEGFGQFTGREAIDPATADLVFEQLKQKHLLVAVEPYPHIYPHCWRTGDELVFRLVDEWFINMDWRREIMAVTETINWLPESIQGRERELEWLQNMRDWMISKKRFWGLALPIWFDEESGDFEVIGSLAELKERAQSGGEGWEEFEGHTPHRPWIDRVKIKNPKTGNLMTRIPDVGNPWLDAGIVPFSTMGYREKPEMWRQWYPADFVTECFPGQFRNWFYSMLALSTMMLHEEPTPEQKRPFKNLLGHRLVMNEHGQQMHKTDGTAIWFEEAAEQLGVDTLRWMYLAQNPAQDLRFGLRHPDEHVTLETPDGPISETKEGLPTCKVTSTPADEVRRQILIPLWNSYGFFANYANLDGFDPSTEAVPVAERPEIDRWILSNLQEVVNKCHESFRRFDTPSVCASAAKFIDDLSNWYIRRNRKRFWQKVGESGIQNQQDKLAAYQTLHDVLVTLSKLLAPCIPFLTERMYQNLVRSWNKEAPESVHLCDYPPETGTKSVAVLWNVEESLNRRMATAQQVVRMTLKLREENSLRVRQPLAELRYACDSPEQAEAVQHLSGVIADELNVKKLTPVESLGDLVHYSYKPNLKTLGPKYGKLLGALRKELPEADPKMLAPLQNGESVTLTVGGTEVVLTPEDVLIETEQAAGWLTASEPGIQVALDVEITPELKAEGMARDFVRHVQQLRKEADLEENQRIRISYHTDSETVAAAVTQWQDTIRAETRADEVMRSDNVADGSKKVTVGDEKIWLWITAD